MYKIGRVYAFMRYIGDDRRIVLAGMSEDEDVIRLDLARYFIDMLIDEDGNEYHAHNGIFYIHVKRYSAMVFEVKYKEVKKCLNG